MLAYPYNFETFFTIDFFLNVTILSLSNDN